MLYYYEEIRIVIEVVSAVMCFILVRFMIKPYEVTGESRYIGLPLGFGFLGATYVLSAFSIYLPDIFGGNTFYIQLIARTFAFLFIAFTYHFSKKPTKNSRWFWKITLTLLFILLIISFLIVDLPNFDNVYSYRTADIGFRVINIIIILYICIHTFRSYIEKPSSTTIWIPIGYAFLAVSQYSTLLFAIVVDLSHYTIFGALILRLIFLSIFLFVAIRTFYQKRR
ncbi:MAG: hypothetical protein NWE99_11125 [Candidatus Bathyarchaeota archaeon]|nr:hypothetical protein [Candidatus Bathyarchaeota archaeon]